MLVTIEVVATKDEAEQIASSVAAELNGEIVEVLNYYVSEQ